MFQTWTLLLHLLKLSKQSTLKKNLTIKFKTWRIKKMDYRVWTWTSAEPLLLEEVSSLLERLFSAIGSFKRENTTNPFDLIPENLFTLRESEVILLKFSDGGVVIFSALWEDQRENSSFENGVRELVLPMVLERERERMKWV